MNTIELIAPCHFGLEAVLKREIIDLGYEISSVEDGRVCFYGDAEAICRANIFLRTAERVLLKVGAFEAVTYDELFEKTKALPWERYIPKDGKVIGLSKLARIVTSFAKRPQLQERLTSQIADFLSKHLNAQGVAVIIEAEHLCMTMRGARAAGAKTQTSALRGTMRSDAKTRSEVMSLLIR